MATNYPNNYDMLASPGATLEGPPSHTSLHVDPADAIEAVQVELGINPSGPHASVAARFTAMESGNQFSSTSVVTSQYVQTTAVVNQPAIAWQEFAGTLNGVGQAVFAHSFGMNRMPEGNFSYAGVNLESIGIDKSRIIIDGTNVHIYPGPGAGRPFHGLVIFRRVSIPWHGL